METDRMNAPDTAASRFAALLADARAPFPGSHKTHLPGALPGVAAPMREITLTNGERVSVYDTSGPYTDPAASIDVRRGLAPVRAGWIAARGDCEPYAGRDVTAEDDGRHGGAIDPRLA
jgi:phosphomethylpyrimidine synthase